MKKTAFTEVKEQVIKPETLCLDAPQASKEQIEITEKIHEKHNLLSKFGIRSKTSEILEKKVDELNKQKEDEKRKLATNQLLKIVSDILFPFNLIETKTLHEIAKNHNLHIAPLSWYKKDIPDECLMELDVFVKNNLNELVNKAKDGSLVAVLEDRLQGFAGTFEFDKYDHSLASSRTDKMFYIVAPIKDLQTDKHTVQIGRELLTVPKPKLELNLLGFHSGRIQFPKLAKDPIIFLPLRVGKSYVSVAITGWDKEWEDPLLQHIL